MGVCTNLQLSCFFKPAKLEYTVISNDRLLRSYTSVNAEMPTE